MSIPKKIFEFDSRACKKGGFLQAGGIKLKSDPCVTPWGAIYKPHIFDFDGRACKKGGFLQAGGIKLKITKNIFLSFRLW